jgi:hypothetical protein
MLPALDILEDLPRLVRSEAEYRDRFRLKLQHLRSLTVGLDMLY